jgi:hypothetical protein
VRFQSFQFLPATAGSPIFPNVFSAIPQGTSGRPDVVFASADFSSPLIYQGQLSLEHELFSNFTLSGIYMATRGQRMPLFRDTNYFPAAQNVTYTVFADPRVGSATTCAGAIERTVSLPFYPGPSTNRPNAAYGRITAAESVVNTWYHGFVVQAKHRFTRGFQMQASFTVSKAIDNDQISQTFSAANQPLDPANVRQDYSLSNFDQRKRFTASAYWVLPFHGISSRPLRLALDGFQLSGILSLGDGRPYSALISGNPTPSGISTGILGVGGSTRVPWAGRNTLTGPGLATTDMRLARALRFSERMKLELIFEAFNVFNRTNITQINTTKYNLVNQVLFPRTDFATTSETGSNLLRERQLQLGARFTF